MTEHITEEKKNRAVLVGLSAHSLPREDCATDSSLEELSALMETAGGVCVGVALQQKDAPDPRTFIGEGKVAEVKALAEAQGADMVVFDNALSPSQQRALTEELGVSVLDRSALILDIFAQRAQTREGRLQVELAQYKYLLPRLIGMWKHLERQEGAIGTRGPGETQLESDRRHIRRKIQKLLVGQRLQYLLHTKQFGVGEGAALVRLHLVHQIGYRLSGESVAVQRMTGDTAIIQGGTFGRVAAIGPRLSLRRTRRYEQGKGQHARIFHETTHRDSSSEEALVSPRIRCGILQSMIIRRYNKNAEIFQKKNPLHAAFQSSRLSLFHEIPIKNSCLRSMLHSDPTTQPPNQPEHPSSPCNQIQRTAYAKAHNLRIRIR